MTRLFERYLFFYIKCTIIESDKIKNTFMVSNKKRNMSNKMAVSKVSYVLVFCCLARVVMLKEIYLPGLWKVVLWPVAPVVAAVACMVFALGRWGLYHL